MSWVRQEVRHRGKVKHILFGGGEYKLKSFIHGKKAAYLPIIAQKNRQKSESKRNLVWACSKSFEFMLVVSGTHSRAYTLESGGPKRFCWVGKTEDSRRSKYVRKEIGLECEDLQCVLAFNLRLLKINVVCYSKSTFKIFTGNSKQQSSSIMYYILQHNEWVKKEISNFLAFILSILTSRRCQRWVTLISFWNGPDVI